jgi:acyl-CoA synthetase (AMP-forming)/AMP-acid ligase II
MSVLQGLRRACQINPQGVATIDGDTRQTWQQFRDRVSRFAGALQAAGVERGDRVAVLSLNRAAYLEYFYAAPWAGVTVVPLNTRLAAPELVAILNDSGSVGLLVDDAFAAMLPALMPELTTVRSVWVAGSGPVPAGATSLNAAIDAAAPVACAEPSNDDLYGVFYTGGTTAASKGVMLSHGNIIANAMNLLAEVPFSPATVHLHAAPMFHLADCTATFALTIASGTHTFVPRFDPVAVMQAIQDLRVTNSILVPAMIGMLVNAPTIADYDLTSFSSLLYGGQSISEAILRRAIECLPGCRFTQAYGMTELSPVATFLSPRYHVTEGPDACRLRAAGRAAATVEIRIADDEDGEVPRGTVGQILVRGPIVMKGYWNQPALTSDALRGGWMHTGDGGYMDDDGFVFVVDRIKDMIITGGENVYSAEVENAIYQHPAVAMCAVIGVPDEQWGERVHAVIALKPGQATTDTDIVAHCRRLIAGYKCPRTVSVRAEPLPLSGAGKVLKTVLRRELQV